jgi:TolB-like protein/Tfp pilus assembly protein PilF
MNQRRSNAGAFVPRSVAVLPFKSIGPSEELEVIGLGMANSVIVDLSSTNGLTVLPTSSVFKYTQRDKDAITIGRELGVDAVLDGTIQRSDDKVHVTALLIKSSDGKSLWSGKFDADFTDTFRLQDSISRELTSTLAANMQNDDRRSQKRPDNLAAYNSYLFGLFFWNKRGQEDITKAVSYLEQSVREDPNLAVAHALLARCYFHIGASNALGPARSDAIARARAEVTRALELDSTLSDAYTVLAYLSLDGGDSATGEQHFHRALALDPNNGEAHLEYGIYLYTRARISEANVELEHAQELAPLSPQSSNARTYVLFLLRDYDGVIRASRKALELRPDYDLASAQLAQAYAFKGMFNEALDATKRIKHPLLFARTKVFVEGLAAHTADAKRTLEEIKRSASKNQITPYQYAVLYAAVDNKSKAFESLAQAVDEVGKRESKQFLAMLLKFDPQLDELRSDARFGPYLSRLQQ